MHRSIDIIVYRFLAPVFKNKYHSVHNCYTCLEHRSRAAAVVIVCRGDFAAINVHLYASLLDIEVTKKNEKTALHKLLLSRLDVFKKIRRILVYL